ncbi:hypothetical protein PR048_001069 [Dryococelus australis]|uniref:Uncharacterized protein n=1 Tax=Dryococelus australis TaxID=614101 RepID=A0ABQ9IHA2_9NEOP|nr:hypothetical protein PR048_001069 [Dryococelus australis]
MFLTKMKFNLDISDKRGTHHNHPHAVSFDVKELVRDHISSMPAQESHYSRYTSSKLYLSSQLCVERMYDLFKDRYPNIECLHNLYRDILRCEFKLRFVPPQSDSCSYCDELYIHLVAAKTEDEQKRISAQSTLHHRKAEKVLHEDVVMSKSKPHICCTLHRYAIGIVLSNTLSFLYSSTYNQCVYNMGTEKPFMFVWNESVAKCVGEIRRLVVCSDRCIAQNHNWWCTALYHYLIVKKYFTTIDHKFLGLCPDCKKKCTVYHPKQWLEDIVNPNPAFSAHYMDKEDFFGLSAIEGMFKNLPNVKITSFNWIQFSSEEPNTVRT